MQHEMITKWAIDKFKLPSDAVVEVSQETVSSGYCETCWYEEEVWEIRSNGELIYTFRDDFASLLKEVLDYAAAKGKVQNV